MLELYFSAPVPPAAVKLKFRPPTPANTKWPPPNTPPLVGGAPTPGVVPTATSPASTVKNPPSGVPLAEGHVVGEGPAVPISRALAMSPPTLDPDGGPLSTKYMVITAPTFEGTVELVIVPPTTASSPTTLTHVIDARSLPPLYCRTPVLPAAVMLKLRSLPRKEKWPPPNTNAPLVDAAEPGPRRTAPRASPTTANQRRCRMPTFPYIGPRGKAPMLSHGPVAGQDNVARGASPSRL